MIHVMLPSQFSDSGLSGFFITMFLETMCHVGLYIDAGNVQWPTTPRSFQFL